jgi:hypothetical protein
VPLRLRGADLVPKVILAPSIKIWRSGTAHDDTAADEAQLSRTCSRQNVFTGDVTAELESCFTRERGLLGLSRTKFVQIRNGFTAGHIQNYHLLLRYSR